MKLYHATKRAGIGFFFLPTSTLCSFMPPRDAIRNLRTFEEARSELMREEGIDE